MKSAKGTHPGCGTAGFSLVELLVTLLVVAEILVVAGLMFDLHSKTARAQNQVADMQQSLRVGQREVIELVRMAGRGGLPSHLPVDTPGGIPSVDQGLAIHVDNNVDADFRIDPDDPATEVVAGTDVLRVRGVFSSPLYQLATSALASARLQLEPGFYGSGSPSVIMLAAALGGAADRMMIVGHQPTWGMVVHDLTGDSVEVKTATLVVIELPIDVWPQLPNTTGTVMAVHHPGH